MDLHHKTKTIMTTQNKLPDKLWKLILVALKDLHKCEQDPKYEIHMMAWHSPSVDLNKQEFCYVCYAGSVLAKSLDFPFDVGISDLAAQLPFEIINKIRALNMIRSGRVGIALSYFYNTITVASDLDFNISVPYKEGYFYEVDKNKWKRKLVQVALALKKRDL